MTSERLFGGFELRDNERKPQFNRGKRNFALIYEIFHYGRKQQLCTNLIPLQTFQLAQ